MLKFKDYVKLPIDKREEYKWEFYNRRDKVFANNNYLLWSVLGTFAVIILLFVVYLYLDAKLPISIVVTVSNMLGIASRIFLFALTMTISEVVLSIIGKVRFIIKEKKWVKKNLNSGV